MTENLIQMPYSVPYSMDAPEDNFTENNVAGAIENSENQKQEAVETVLAGAAEKRWPGWPGESVFRLLVPAHKVGGIIGRKGESIKKMCEESKARIKILDGPPGTPERVVRMLFVDSYFGFVNPLNAKFLNVFFFQDYSFT